MELETAGEVIIVGGTPYKKPFFKQRYRKEWETYEQFTSWLTASEESEHHAFCKLCSKKMTAHLYTLQNHTTSNMHLINLKRFEAEKEAEIAALQKPIKEAIHSAEMRLAKFFVDHNVPFRVASKFIPLLKNIFGNSDGEEIAKNIKLGRTKCKKVMKSIMDDNAKNKNNGEMKSTYLSILVDESGNPLKGEELTKHLKRKRSRSKANTTNGTLSKAKTRTVKRLVKPDQMTIIDDIAANSDGMEVMDNSNMNYMNNSNYILADDSEIIQSEELSSACLSIIEDDSIYNPHSKNIVKTIMPDRSKCKGIIKNIMVDNAITKPPKKREIVHFSVYVTDTTV